MVCKYSFKTIDLKRMVYWITSKFKLDPLHLQGTSTRRDLIGGFIDRWINRAPEFIVFEGLLKNKDFAPEVDFFFYGQDTEKNAPDVLGLKDTNTNRTIVKFAEYINGTWKQIDNRPWIEVKTRKNNQYLFDIGKTQMNNNHYYAIVESNIDEDYLTSLFENSLFSEEIKNSIETSQDYIKSDNENQILKPIKLEKTADIGYFTLIGIFKGSEIKKFSKLYCNDDQPVYLRDNKKDFEKVENIRGANQNIKLDQGYYNHSLIEDNLFLPFFVKYLNNSSLAVIKKKNKWSIYVKIRGSVKINNTCLEEGLYKFSFREMERTSGSKEYMGYKNVLVHAKDVEVELISLFDKLAQLNN